MYNIKEKSLYVLFSQYDTKIIDLVLEIFSLKEHNAFRLLERKYGSNFDGNNALNDLSFMEKDGLQKVLSRFEIKLKCCTILHKKGQSIDSIKALYKEKNTVETIKLEKIIIDSTITNNRNQIEFTSAKQILNKYNVSMDQLYDAISLVDSYVKRSCYMYRYGINRPVMPVDDILDLLKISKLDFNKNILEVQSQLPALLGINKDQVNNPSKVSDKINKSNQQPELEKKKPVKTIKKPKFKPTYYDYFYEEDMTEEEKLKIKKLVDSYMKKTISEGAEVVFKIYGKNLDEYHDIVLTEKQKRDFRNLKRLLEGYIQQSLSNEDFSPRSKTFRPIYYEYFYKENMTEEEKLKIKELVDNYMKKTRSPKKKVVFMIYGETLDEYHDVVLTKKQSQDFQNMNGIITRHILQFLPKKSCPAIANQTDQETTKSFHEYFYEENMNNAEKEMVQELVDTYMKRFVPDFDQAKIMELNEEELKKEPIYKAIQNYIKFKFTQREKQKNEQIEASPSKEELFHPCSSQVSESINETIENLEYLDQLIINLYNNGNDLDEICKLLTISEDVFIECYLKNSHYFKNEIKILEHILLNETNMDHIRKLLCSPLFDKENSGLTNIEKGVLYMKFLQLKDQNITDEVISQATKFDIELIRNYQLITKDDRINQLNKFLRKSN